MLKRSTAKNFKLITGRDLFALHKKMESEQKKEEGNVTELMDFLQYGLYLALFETNIATAKQQFQKFLETYMFDTNEETLTSLTKIWEKEIK